MTTDYKKTLNLPQTAFAMKANLPQREPEMLQYWQGMNLYQKIRQQNQNKKRFVFHDGPPYANGNIHVGHAVNKILKDMIVKAKTLSGFDVPYVPGWDCHGLPIELRVEKKIGKAGVKVSAAEFRAACRDYAYTQMEVQSQEFQRLGILADWQNPYYTMDPQYEANIIRSLAKIIQRGDLLKGYKPVYWCLDCASALAEAEVEYADKHSPAIDVRFRVVHEEEFLQKFPEQVAAGLPISIPIWTTTPWTLPANQAVALNPEIDYVLVECDNTERLLIAEALLLPVMARVGCKTHQVIARLKGEQFVGVALQHPFYDRHVPVVLGEHVTIDAGTGAVHTAPAHGQDDFLIAKKYQLPLDNPVGDDGCFITGTPLFAGVHVNKVNDLVIAELKAKNHLLHLASIRHSYPHCWRHKTPIIFRATPQWFISMDQQGLRSKTLQAIETVSWIPSWGKARIISMAAHRPDWCISRQRLWGVPLSIFLHKETGALHPNTIELMAAVAQRVEQQGIEAWYDLDPEELLGKDAVHYYKCRDILDVWFDSGVSHECVLQQRPELSFPADLYLEGSDQHRGWFNSSLLTSVAMNDVAPYKTVLTHGYVIDVDGQKMSKSLGNVIAPADVIQKLGADVLRLWVASIDYRGEVNVSHEILTRTSETYRRIRNTARFLLANLHDFDPARHKVSSEMMLSLDRWAVDKALHMQQEILAAYEQYQFHLIYQRLHYFCTVDMGSFYLDIIKDRQYTMPTDSLGRRSAQTAIFHILEALVRWLAPILSYTAEEIWQAMPGVREESVFLSDSWYEGLFALPGNAAMNQVYWEQLRLVRDAVNKEIEGQRAAGLLGSALEAEVQLYCAPELKAQLDQLENELRFVLITSKAEVLLADTPALGVATEVPGLSVKIQPTAAVKCERCWHRLSDVGTHQQHPTLCSRCVCNVDGTGEVRKYA